MFSIFKKPLKDRLKEELEKARKEHEMQIQKENTQNTEQTLPHAKEQLRAFAQMGRLDENKAFLASLKTQCSEEEYQKLFEYAQQEECEYLKLALGQSFRDGDKEKSNSLLSILQQYLSEDVFLVYHQAAENGKMPSWIDILKAQGKQWWKKHFSEKWIPKIPQNTLNSWRQSESVDTFAKTEEILKKQEERKLSPIELPEENVNGFESIFGTTNEDEKDILDTILQSTQKQEEKPEEGALQEQTPGEKFSLTDEEQEQQIEYVNPFLPYLGVLSKIALASIVLLCFSWGFFFLQTDPQNTVLSTLAQDNLFVQKQKLSETLDTLKKEKASLELRLKKLQQGAADIPVKIAIDEIQTQKIDWLDLREQLHKATLEAFPYNDVLQYIVYTSFQGDAEKGTISIAGTITEPSGRVFFLTTKLIQAINAHPSFSGAEIKTFSKAKNPDAEIGGSVSSFALSLKYKTDITTTNADATKSGIKSDKKNESSNQSSS